MVEMLKVAEVATYLRVSATTVREEIRDGRLPAVRVGRCLRIPRADLERYVAANRSAIAGDGR